MRGDEGARAGPPAEPPRPPDMPELGIRAEPMAASTRPPASPFEARTADAAETDSIDTQNVGSNLDKTWHV